MALLSIIFWRIWFLRNHVVHGMARHDMSTVVKWCRDYLAEIRSVIAEVTEVNNRVLIPAVIKWQPPRDGYYKVNTNATLDMKRQRVGLGLVVRDYHAVAVAVSSAIVVPPWRPENSMVRQKSNHFHSKRGQVKQNLKRGNAYGWEKIALMESKPS
ncbi:hypothetical protein LWI29_007220 [Acer saccharum]|uniref:Uncharacterized protein n=1 Tax=Acer saccharum TaxID=4024 RepID=A0AA39T156_ACESA|nr:hypothetical protein LWI29_007220 [Acer saccharum]